MTIIERHADYLREQAAITAETAEAAGIRSATTVAELPEWARSWGDAAVPALVFPWYSPSGEVVEQVRPDTPIAADGQKYLWPKGRGSVLNAARPVTDEHDTVLIVEGTKQTWAAAAYAPANVAVYGVGGCRNWSSDGIPLADLMVVEDKRVVIALDADAATNLDVYTAGLRISEACTAEGATAVSFLRLAGVGGTNGLDDVLAKRASDMRASYLTRLIAKPKSKPADAKPSVKRRDRMTLVAEPSNDRPRIYMDSDRRDVINQVSEALINRWNATKMFDHGGVLSILSTERRLGQETAPVLMALDRRTMTDLVQDTIQSVRNGPEGQVVYVYPEGATLDAIFSRYRMFAPIDRVARVPFVRRDGSICQTPGYDDVSRTFLSLDPELEAIQVPDDPTGDDIAWAVKLIREEWLHDFFGNMPDEASRTNTVALAMTPFIRGLVPIVPMSVVDGLQMGVGKNLLADVAVAIPATGAGVEPMNWDQQDDQENRKQITSAFKDGADVYVFDEAHRLHGASLARVITAATWKDRNLGHSQMLGFRNQVTWVALGNNVEIAGDIIRRVYRIALRPNVPNPQDRPSSAFRIPDIRRWTTVHRAEIVTAMLTLVRAWFAAGQPAAKETSFGSFEEWERIVGGVLRLAGFTDFLGNTASWRRESNYDALHWEAHVHWLWETFGESVFSADQVREAMVGDRTGSAEPPPGLTDMTMPPKDYNRALGKAYSKYNGVFFDGVKLMKSDQMVHGHVQGWRVYGPESEYNTSDEKEPLPPDLTPSSGGLGGSGGEKSPTRGGENTSSPEPAHTRFREVAGISDPPDPPDPLTVEESSEVGRPSDENRQDSADTGTIRIADSEIPWDGVEQPSLFAGESVTPVVDPVPYTAVDLTTWAAEGDVLLPDSYVVIDIEGGSAQLWPKRDDAIRITGVQQGNTIRIHPDGAEVADLLRRAKMIVGHNLMGFDLVAFALHHGVDIHELAEQGRLIDTMLTEVVVNPPEARTKQGQIMRALGLDALGTAKKLGAKSHDLGALAKKYGGYGSIPIDDVDYVTYCAQDVNLAAQIAQTQGRSTYAIREHRIAAIAAQIRLNGFRVDRDLLARRVADGEALRVRRLNELQERYGLPMTLPSGKPAKSPHATKEGKAAIERAFNDLGVELGRTKSGGPAFGKEARDELLERYADQPDVLELLDTVGSLLGIRSVYGTVERCLAGDRVHPNIAMFQASGRWSITEPGLTVMGKRGGRYVEREVFLPEPGHVIISADLSQVDARAVAAWCQDPGYLELFGPNRDSHDEIAIAVWGDVPRPAGAKHPRREDAKILGHGWNYGMGIQKLAAKIGDEDTAREFDRAMKERYPGLVAWKQDVAAKADSGELLDNGFGRRLRTTPGFGWTQGPALMGQSAARDILMEGLLRLPRDLHPYLRAVVHDEVVLSIPVEQANEIEARVIEALSFPWAPREGYRPVQIEAGLAKRGINWGACYAK